QETAQIAEPGVGSRPGCPLLQTHRLYPLSGAAPRLRVFHREPDGFLDVAILLLDHPLQVSHLATEFAHLPLLLSPEAAAENEVIQPRAQPGKDNTRKDAEQYSPAENPHQSGIVRNARALPSVLACQS